MTDRDPYPSEKQDRFIVRLPDGMRDRIKLAAERNQRSMNAEIVATLEKEYPDPMRDLEHIETWLVQMFRRLPAEMREEELHKLEATLRSLPTAPQGNG